MPKFVKKPVVVEARWDKEEKVWFVKEDKNTPLQAFTDKEFKKLYEEVKI